VRFANQVEEAVVQLDGSGERMKHAKTDELSEMDERHPAIKLRTYLDLSSSAMSIVPRELLVELLNEYERLRFVKLPDGIPSSLQSDRSLGRHRRSRRPQG
jgi:hypothetical protein